jgi:hypothetical protein
LTTAKALDYEPEEGESPKRTYTVTVTATDDDAENPLADTITVTIIIEAVETTNNAPAFLATETGARSVPEGVPRRLRLIRRLDS